MKPTREEVLRLMRQASGGILTQVAEDPRCGYEIKVEELQTFATLLQASNECGSVPDIQWRKLLAITYCGFPALYCDDGELQDNRTHPDIDFKRDSVDEIWDKMRRRTTSALQSGISSPSHRPNEQNAVAIDESDLKLAFFDGYGAAVEDATNGAVPVIEFAWKRRQEGKQ